MDLDYVCLVSPPGFRPQHFEAAVEANKHIFAEKPLGTDPVGVRRIREAAEKAKGKGLSVVVGLNARHSLYSNDLVKRVHDGAIGKILGGRSYRMHGGLWHRGSDPSWTPMEYQCRNWYYFCWLSGDQITEMAVHSMDFVNWVMNSTPVSAVGSGGRTQRTDPKYGNIWDNMSIDYEYPDDVHVFLMVRQWDDCANANGNFFMGCDGTFNSREITGKNAYSIPREARDEVPSGQYEHWKLIDSIKKGKAINNALEFACDSTLTTILGREAAYTGKRITWEEILTSNLDLGPKGGIQFGPAPERGPAVPAKPRA
jgi:predicted dehydrogenase